MQKIIDGSCMNKTRRLMEYSVANGAIFVCANPTRALEKASKYGIEGLRSISYSEYFTIWKAGEKYCVDDLDNFITTTLPGITGFSLTYECGD